jgi:hypothetical protein
MADENGSNSAGSPDNSKRSLNGGPNDSRKNAGTLADSSDITLDEMIGMHLVDCSQCRETVLRGPVAIGQRSGHCDVYWGLQLLRANEEGSVNNIVAYTEHGDEAKKGRPLE